MWLAYCEEYPRTKDEQFQTERTVRLGFSYYVLMPTCSCTSDVTHPTVNMWYYTWWMNSVGGVSDCTVILYIFTWCQCLAAAFKQPKGSQYSYVVLLL